MDCSLKQQLAPNKWPFCFETFPAPPWPYPATVAFSANLLRVICRSRGRWKVDNTRPKPPAWLVVGSGTRAESKIRRPYPAAQEASRYSPIRVRVCRHRIRNPPRQRVLGAPSRFLTSQATLSRAGAHPCRILSNRSICSTHKCTEYYHRAVLVLALSQCWLWPSLGST